MPKLEEIEDIDDIDNMDMDLAEFDPDLSTPIAPARPKPTIQRSQDSEPINDPIQQMMQSMGMGGAIPPSVSSSSDAPSGVFQMTPEMANVREPTAEEAESFKKLNILYPCYFDKNRSTKQGRRVPLDKAIENPLCSNILTACRISRLQNVVFEADKTHPQDFGNPGRIRFEMDPNTNKRQVLNQIGEYLIKHQTKLADVKKYAGPPELMSNQYKPMEVPKVKGFKMNTIVPLHSPFTMKNPETASAYDRDSVANTPEITPKSSAKKMPKQKVQRIRM